jgi:nucleotide-binding universal stress UspA family protein
MYTSIVVGVDGSPTAEIALERAIEIACVAGASLHVVSAYDPVPARVTGGAPAGEEYQISPSFKADAVLQRALDRAATRELDIQQHAPKGSPADALVAAAGENEADLIVIGSVGMQGPKRIFGSVPNSVSHRSPCDVLIVHTQER